MSASNCQCSQITISRSVATGVMAVSVGAAAMVAPWSLLFIPFILPLTWKSCHRCSFQGASERILRAKPTEAESQEHILIRSSMSSQQKHGVDALQMFAEAKGGQFLLVDGDSTQATDVDTFAAAFVQDWDVAASRKKGLLHVLSLQRSDFDSDGDKIFPCRNGQQKQRGGLTYYQPDSNWVRIGLNVKEKYDEGKNDWLKSDGSAEEWAIGFHGSSEQGTKGIAQSREFWVSGSGQAYRESIDSNCLSDNKGKKCGKGAYFAAKIGISEAGYASYKPDGITCVLQVRMKPDKTRIPVSQQDYRIVNEPKFIRPYGLCLKMNSGNERRRYENF